MKNTDLLLASAGHFDPFTLSIYESAKDARAWRAKADHLASPGTHLADELLLLAQGTQRLHRGDLTSSLISTHEQDHFIRHVSSEIGLLLTLIHQLRYLAEVGYCRAVFGSVGDADRYENEIRHLNFLHEAIWSSNSGITQGDATAMLNRFFKQFSLDGPAFTTANPNKPHCPAPFLTYKNILEASAVLTEMIRAEAIQLEPSFIIERLTTYFNYDFDTYGAPLQWIFEQVDGYIPAAMLAVRLCLDSRVPVIGSPYFGPVQWEEFQPGYRLLNFAAAAQNAIKLGFTDNFKKAFEQNSMTMYTKELQMYVYDHMAGIAKHVGKLKLWDDPEVANYETNLDLLVRRSSPDGQNMVEAIAKGSRSSFVLTHLFKAFNNYKEERKLNSLTFYSPLITFNEDSPPDSSFARTPNHYFVIFSIFDKTIDSFYLKQMLIPVFHVVQMHFMRQAIEYLLRGEVLNDILTRLEKEFTFVHDILNKEFWEHFREIAPGNLLGTRE